MVAATKSPSPASSSAPVESVVWTDDLAREHGFEPLRI
jgi:hypothetical protein